MEWDIHPPIAGGAPALSSRSLWPQLPGVELEEVFLLPDPCFLCSQLVLLPPSPDPVQPSSTLPFTIQAKGRTTEVSDALVLRFNLEAGALDLYRATRTPSSLFFQLRI